MIGDWVHAAKPQRSATGVYRSKAAMIGDWVRRSKAPMIGGWVARSKAPMIGGGTDLNPPNAPVMLDPPAFRNLSCSAADSDG